jgi:hypothetical protein
VNWKAIKYFLIRQKNSCNKYLWYNDAVW